MQKDLTEQELRNEIQRLAPFHHRVELPYELSTYVPELSRRKIEFTRVTNLVEHAFPLLVDVCGGSLKGRRVLDVACNCGGFSVEAAKLGAEYVLGIDVVDHYIEQANFIKRALKLDQIEFQRMNIEDLDTSTVGEFDITFCFGILYHLENPVLSMKRIASVTKNIMLLDTNVIPTPLIRKSLWSMNMPPVSSGLESKYVTACLWRSQKSVVRFVPNETAVVELLKFLGFAKVKKLKPKLGILEKRYHKRTRATYLALRS